ncbi:hypothetical protein MWU49_09565 [Alcanivorax sp. S6407]|uniref:hypothetical protein n=1 Tax=Alcanivorax sp. S6407 TaxID=2926424 RepID=UPI001FF687EE|nr:hypothetical protein [Alcanivorax sp. S6407]MCK0153950.1 hypothetical protein [Alcanivorax sp. S6407]
MTSTRKDIIRIVGITCSIGLITACGGGGSGGSSSTTSASSNPADQDVTPNDPLRMVKAASFVDEDAVAILAPGSVIDDTMLPLTRMATNLNLALGVDLTGSGRASSSYSCETSGSFQVLEQKLEATNSPYSGGNFDMISSVYKSCVESTVTSGGSPATFSGFRKIGYPVSGPGSGEFANETSFIGYEKSGISLDEPLSAKGVLGGNIDQSRYLSAHMLLERADTGTEAYGATGGGTSQYSVVRMSSNFEDKKTVTLTQLGDEENNLWLEYEPQGDNPVEESHIERYEGIYGMEFLAFQGGQVPASCPQGHFEVKTVSDLYVGKEDEDPKYSDDSYRISSGSLQMKDESGKTATVVYNGAAETITISLDSGTPKVYTLQQVEDLRSNRCYKPALGF